MVDRQLRPSALILRGGGPSSTACPPQAPSWGHGQGWARRPHVPPLTHLSPPRRPLAVSDPRWKQLGCCHQDPALLSSVPCHATLLVTTLIAPRTQWPILATELPWSFSKPLFWDSHSHGLPSDPHRLFRHWDEGWANSPQPKTAETRGQSWAGLAPSVPT